MTSIRNPLNCRNTITLADRNANWPTLWPHQMGHMKCALCKFLKDLFAIFKCRKPSWMKCHCHIRATDFIALFSAFINHLNLICNFHPITSRFSRDLPNQSGMMIVCAEELDEGQRESVYFVCRGIKLQTGSSWCCPCLVEANTFLEFYRLLGDGRWQIDKLILPNPFL
jgi:hypothetical protein